MCSIIGCSGNWDKEIIHKILINSRIRGLHSFGFSYVDEIVKTKKYLNFNEFVEELLEIHPQKFIAHFRYSTSGDWKMLENNQPININSISLVFNGVIDMKTKLEMEFEYNIKMQTENDGEIAIIEFIKGKENFKEFINKKGRTFAGMFIDNNNQIFAFRNNLRPMAVSLYENVKYIASTKDILKRSNLNKIENILPNKYYEF